MLFYSIEQHTHQRKRKIGARTGKSETERFLRVEGCGGSVRPRAVGMEGVPRARLAMPASSAATHYWKVRYISPTKKK